MTLIEATKTCRPLTRKNKTWFYQSTMMFSLGNTVNWIMPGTYIDPEYFFSIIKLTQEDILANDWIGQGGLTDSDYETIE